MSIEVTQADREAAASGVVLPEMRDLIRAGRSDHLAEAWAKHRQQAVAAEVAQIVAMLEKWIDDTMGQSIDPAYLIERIQRGEYKETAGE